MPDRGKERSLKLEHHAGSKSRVLGERSHKQGSGKYNWGHVPDRLEEADSFEQARDKDGLTYESDMPQQTGKQRETRREDESRDTEVKGPQ